MPETHTSPFEIVKWDQSMVEEPETGPAIARAEVHKIYRGDLAGTAVAQLVLCGESSYSAIERVSGTVGGRAGTFVLAPNWDVTFSGTFGAVAGSIAAEKITFTGAASAQITGSVVTLGNYPLVVGGSTTLTLTEPGLQRQPGLRFTERFAPVKSSYKEVRPQSEAVAAAPVGGT